MTRIKLCSLITVIFLFVSVQVACAATPEPESMPEGTGQSGTLAGETPAPTATGPFDGVLTTRTPAPTTTPDLVTQGLEQLAGRAGLTCTTFLGVTAPDWISLGISLLFILAGYLLGTWLIRRALPRIVRRTATDLDEVLLEAVGLDVRWLVVVLALSYATDRLAFVAAWVKELLADAYFVVGLFIGLRIVWHLIDLGHEWFREWLAQNERLADFDPIVVLLVRVTRIVVAVIGLSILLAHFGINVTAFVAALGVAGLAFSLAAQDTIADAIAGFIILVDRPFRIGDRIEIQGVDTWGDVVSIGLRTTRIRTCDNRMVIVPNSTIGSNQVINYSYPDPQYRVETHVGIAYGTDIEEARRVIVGAVQQVEGVLSDKPVDALYIKMGDSAMIFRVRWWIESYVDARHMSDRVHTALQNALDEAGIECPFPTQTLNLQVKGETATSFQDWQ